MGIVIYSKPDCSYCVKAKSLLLSKGKTFTETVVGQDIIREEFIELFPSVKTLPLIFAEGKQIGGYTELVEYLDNNSAQLLTE